MRIESLQIPAPGSQKANPEKGSFTDSLKGGERLSAEVVSVGNGTAMLKTESGQIFNAKILDTDIALASGDKLLLEVVSNEDGDVVLSIVREDTESDRSVQQQRLVSNFDDKSLAPMAAKLAELNLPVSEKTAYLMRELMHQNPSMSLDEAAFIASNKLTGDAELVKAALALLEGGTTVDAAITRLIAMLNIPESAEPPLQTPGAQSPVQLTPDNSTLSISHSEPGLTVPLQQTASNQPAYQAETPPLTDWLAQIADVPADGKIIISQSNTDLQSRIAQNGEIFTQNSIPAAESAIELVNVQHSEPVNTQQSELLSTQQSEFVSTQQPRLVLAKIISEIPEFSNLPAETIEKLANALTKADGFQFTIHNSQFTMTAADNALQNDSAFRVPVFEMTLPQHSESVSFPTSESAIINAPQTAANDLPPAVVTDSQLTTPNQDSSPPVYAEHRAPGSGLPNVSQPEPINVTRPEPFDVRNPETINAIQAETADVQRPETINVTRTEPLDVRNPELLNVTQPETADVQRPETINVTRPESLDVRNPELLNVTQPETADVQRPEAINVTHPESLDVRHTETVSAAHPETVSAADPQISNQNAQAAAVDRLFLAGVISEIPELRGVSVNAIETLANVLSRADGFQFTIHNSQFTMTTADNAVQSESTFPSAHSLLSDGEKLAQILAEIPEFRATPLQALERFSNTLIRVAGESSEVSGGDTEKLKALLENLFTRIERGDAGAGERLKGAKEELFARLSFIEEAIARASPPARTEMLEQTRSLMDHVRLLNNIGQFVYMQLPVKMGSENKTAELYLFKRKGGRKPDPENVNILLAIDLEHMGRWEALVNIRGRDVSIKMEVRGEEEKDFFTDNTILLHNMLEEAGFKLTGSAITHTAVKTTPLTALTALSRHTHGRSGSIDFRI